MFAAWWLPRFGLQALGLNDRRRQVALVGAETAGEPGAPRGDALVLAASAAAERAGVAAGMTVSQALARCPRLDARRRDPEAERRAKLDLRECAEGFTPDHESTGPGLRVLDLCHLGRPVSEDDPGAAMLAALAARGWQAGVGLAANPDLAVLAARLADGVLLLPEDRRQRLRMIADLPVAALEPPPRLRAVLDLWGVRTLGALLRLPRQEVVLRLGREGGELRDLAAGEKQRLLRLEREAPEFADEVDLGERPVESLAPLMRELRRLAERLCARLADSWLMAGGMSLELRFDDGAAHRRDLRLAEPARDTDLLCRVLETHLAGLSAPAPVVWAGLRLVPARAVESQTGLFDCGLRDPNRFAETLAALEALLGQGRLGRAVPLPGHRPDAFQMEAFLAADSGGAQVKEEGGGTVDEAPEPLLRLRPPVPVEVRVLQGGAPARLRLAEGTRVVEEVEGPWRLSGGWWDDHQRWDCELWDARLDDGRRVRLSRQGGKWLLAGFYG